VDGTLIQAWASHKSFRPKDSSDDEGGDGSNFTACGVASKVSNLSEWHNRMVMPAASRKPSSG
jgi:hypothetical protein